MRIACWSGPRNISTALMRSWSSRKDTFVSDEPFYSYYLKSSGIKHPMKDEIIKKYNFNRNEIIKKISSDIPNNKKIWYQKHMAHHMINIHNFSWITNFKNCILIRHPKYVINSYVQKNVLKDVNELGYPQQVKIIEFLLRKNLPFYIVNSDELITNPKKELIEWCKNLNLEFDEAMLSWDKGPHLSDGIWGEHWYDKINQSTGFSRTKKTVINEDNLKNHKQIFSKAMTYYEKIYNMI